MNDYSTALLQSFENYKTMKRRWFVSIAKYAQHVGNVRYYLMMATRQLSLETNAEKAGQLGRKIGAIETTLILNKDWN